MVSSRANIIMMIITLATTSGVMMVRETLPAC